MLDAQAKALHQAKAGAIHQARHEPHVPLHLAQDGPDLLSRQDDREPLGPARADDGAQVSELLAEYVPVEQREGRSAPDFAWIAATLLPMGRCVRNALTSGSRISEG